MKAAVIKQHGPPESIQIENRSVQTYDEKQILIRVKACGLNHLDTWVRRGVPGHKFPLPIVPGSDFAGVVEQVGTQVSGFKQGDKVIVDPGISCGACTYCDAGQEHLCSKWGLLGESTDGGCQEYFAVDARQVHKLPDTLTFEQGACVPVAYVTAWQMLVEKAKIRKGQSILIHAAGSGVSIACIQIAKLFGLQIFVTSTSDEKLRRAKMLGADRFINSAKESFRDSVKLLTAKQGVDFVVDHVGQPTIMDSIRCLKKGGMLLSCGATAGAEIQIDWKHVFFKNIALMGSTYGSRKDFEAVLKLFAESKLSPVIHSILKLDELSKAHRALETRETFGKVIISL